MWPGASPSSLANGAAGLTIAALVIAGLYFGSPIFIPFVLAGVLSFILQPLVRWLHRRYVPRTAAVLGVVLATTLAIGLLVSFIAREASFLAAELPKYESNLREKAKDATDALQRVGIWYNVSRLYERLESDVTVQKEAAPLKVEVQQNELRPFVAILEYVKLTLIPLTTLALVFIFTVLILLQYYDLRDRVVYLFGPTEIGRTTQAFNEAAHDLSKYFRLQASLNLSFGIVIGVCLWLVGLPNAALWAALAALSRFVPYIGGVIAAAGPLLMAAAVDPTWATVLTVGAIILVAEMFVGYVVEPLLFGTKTRMSPLAVVTAAVFWTTLWGPIGLILALPITLAVIVFGEHVPRLRFLQVLFGNNPTLSDSQRLYHLLLANHPARAFEDLSRYIAEKKSLFDYMDQVFIPAMALASKDVNNGILKHSQREELKQAIVEFAELFKETVKMRATERDSPSAPLKEDWKILLISARGAFDQAIVELTSVLLREESCLNVTASSLGGLTGIAQSAANENAVDYFAIATTGSVTDSQLNLLLRRAKRDLVPLQIAVLRGCVGDKSDNTSYVKMFHSVKALEKDILQSSTAKPANRDQKSDAS